MLDNLIGNEDIPKPALIEDIKRLGALEKKHLNSIGNAIQSLSEIKIEGSIIDSIVPELKNTSLDNKELEQLIGVTFLLWQKWALHDLTRKQVDDDIKGLGLPQENFKNLIALFDVLESKLYLMHEQLSEYAEYSALHTGTPIIETVHTAIDVRAVFKYSGQHVSRSNKQPSLEIDYFVPVVIMEFVSELNNEKSTHSYLLTESTIEELSDILSGVQKQLQVIKSQLPSKTN